MKSAKFITRQILCKKMPKKLLKNVLFELRSNKIQRWQNKLTIC